MGDAWSQPFRRACADRIVQPHYLAESIAVDGFRPYGGELKLSSFVCPGYTHAIALEGSSVSHGELQIPAFSRTADSMTLGLTRDVRRHTSRGQVVRVRLGFPGWSPAAFEPIFVGVVRSLTWRAGLWELGLVDLAYGLTSRFPDAVASAALFGGSLSDTTVSGTAYTVGDGTLNVVSTVGLEQSNYAGGEGYVLLITPTTGAAFYVHATGKTANTFTGLGGALFNTTAVNAAIGSTVDEVAYTETHPLNIVRRILVSTGTSTTSAVGTNGDRDVLPEPWGIGLPPGVVDGSDFVRQVRLSSPASGANDWVLVEHEEQDNPLSWIAAFLQPGGFFLSHRQGLVTGRAVVDVDAADDVSQVTDQDIGAVDSYEAWDRSQVVEHRRLTVTTPDGGSTSETEASADTRPLLETRTLDLPDCWTNESAWRTSVIDRLSRYLLRVPERLTLSCPGWRLAHLSPGDVVELTTSIVSSRYAQEGYDFVNRRALVVGGGADWFNGGTRLQLLVPPPLPGASG